ncbi:MAG: protein translocase SEC61 complex subunit gamma [Nanoarchaeota archaeon]
MQEKIKSFLIQCNRVWRVLRKPSGMEYKTVSKVAALGLLALGLLGFVISLIVKEFVVGA